ncbi:MAG TPA: hypothetical protein VFZ28_04370 [Burkholderiaceae bacterium]|nr:hypothetical protein [Burkholderiaceae bacterium]
MVSQWTPVIAERLSRVRALRRERDADRDLHARVEAVKRFQHARFMRDYAVLSSDPRYASAARFFLEELYSPGEFAGRDTEFERVVPWAARLLPSDLMRTIADLIELHALTEELDQHMAYTLRSVDVDDACYRAAWGKVARRADRERQLELLLAVGRELDRHTRSKALAAMLRMMRRPAQAAGLGRLQTFLEAGMAAFAEMRGAQTFLRTIELNESRMIEILFGGKQNPVREI